MAEDTDGGRLDDGSSNKRTLPATDIHPFFKPLSKRANTAVSCGSNAPSADAASIEPKRPKQKAVAQAAEKRGRKAKAAGKPTTTLQSFFAVKSAQPDAQTPLQPGMPAKADQSVVVVDNECIDVEAKTTAELPQQPRPKLRSAGIPAPYPAETPHIPAPIYKAFEPAACAAAAPGNMRFLHKLHTADIPAALELYTQGQPHAESDGGSTQWRELAGEVLQLQQQQRLRALSLDGMAGASILASFGAPLPRKLQHLQFAEPLLDILCGRKSHDQSRHSQLLAFRYRPRRARDVLDNRNSVAQLQSWIEGMRLKRTAASASSKYNYNIVPAVAIDARAQCSHSRVGNKGTERQNQRSVQRSADTASDSDDAAHFMDDSDDDDFIPSKPRRNRRAKKVGGLDDVLAWAQSDGTMTSVREKMRVSHRHRRRGSESGGSGSETESFSNIILLEGPSGACKTAAVYACASECGFEVYEIHPGQRRSGKDVLAVLEDVIQSHTITMPSGSTSAADRASVNQMLILIEHIDVLFEQDQRLWPALKQLALKSRRPIVLTCNDMACIRWETACFHSVLRFKRPDAHFLVPYLFMLCLAEDVLVSPVDIARTCADAKCDVNRILSQLEFMLRLPKYADGDYISPIPAPPDKPTQIDLSGTLEWLSRSLDAGETMQARFNLWMSLVASAQTPGESGWVRSWPDRPPPPSPPSRLASLSRVEMPAAQPKFVSIQNRFFDQRAHLDAVPSDAADHQIATTSASGDDPKDTLLRRVTPLVLNQPRCVDIPAGTTFSCTSDITQLDSVAEAMDTLSLVCTFRDSADIIDECLCEPLHTTLSPMADGCLDVDYILLDPEVVTRHNPTRLPDGIGAERHATMQIDEHLNMVASQRLCAFPGLELDTDESRPSLASQRGRRPLGPSVLESDYNDTLLSVCSVMSFVGIQSQQIAPEGVADTVTYLSNMIKWDWVHQGRLKPPAAIAASADNDSDEHVYRIGTRRTRQRTYRVHIKYMTSAMQQFLISWNHFK